MELHSIILLKQFLKIAFIFSFKWALCYYTTLLDLDGRMDFTGQCSLFRCRELRLHDVAAAVLFFIIVCSSCAVQFSSCIAAIPKRILRSTLNEYVTKRKTIWMNIALYVEHFSMQIFIKNFVLFFFLLKFINCTKIDRFTDCWRSTMFWTVFYAIEYHWIKLLQ